MRVKALLAALMLLLAGACATAGSQASGTSIGGSAADGLTDAVATYKSIEPRLTAQQREEFKDAYGHVASAYQTAGVLLTAIVDAQDEASAHTAIVSYQMTMSALPKLTNKVVQMVQGFKAGAKR